MHEAEEAHARLPIADWVARERGAEVVSVAELRQNLSRYLRDVERGERLLVTDRNRA